MGSYRFWIHEKDRKGRPIDKTILQAAEEIASTVTQYRQQEIGCASTSNELLQLSVEATSNAMRRGHIKNPHGYLTSTYRRLVDRFLEDEWRLVPADDAFLEDFANTLPASSFEERIHTDLLLEKLLQAMDPETRQISEWRLQGYSEKEIAGLMQTTPNAIAMRFSRGLKKAMRRHRRNR